MDITNDIKKLDRYLNELAEEFGGDIVFNPPISESKLYHLEKVLDYKFPEIFRWFYTKKFNGIIIDNKSVIGVFDENNKNTFVENLSRYNDKTKELFFKGREMIFDDYVIIGYDCDKIFCLSKKYDFPNPLLYICKNQNSPSGVDIERIDFDLEHLLRQMVENAYGDDDSDDLVIE